MNIIRSYGLLWDRPIIEGRAPRLTGVAANRAQFRTQTGLQGGGKGSTNRDLPIVDHSKQPGLYVCHDDRGSILYVGRAGGGKTNRCILDRLREHLDDDWAGSWSQFSWFGLYGVDVRHFMMRDGLGVEVDWPAKVELDTGSFPVALTVEDAQQELESLLLQVLRTSRISVFNTRTAEWEGAIRYEYSALAR